MERDGDVVLVPFDDGHTPGSTTVRTQMALYRNKHSEKIFAVFDDLLPLEWCKRGYDYAVARGKPWGAYISTEDALNVDDLSAEDIWKEGNHERAISLVAVRKLLFERADGLIGPDRATIHGTAVWCLASDETDSVQYHIDYAELYRYETNIIYPPIYAGTCHLSPLNGDADMIGGDFQANVRGVDHYKQFGYKGKLASPEAFQEDLLSADWVRARYRFNRGILHDGNYPHLSTKVTHLKPGTKRVILGFNSFPRAVGECCTRAPEHSDAFNRTIKLYQTMAALGVPVTEATGSGTSTVGGAESHAAHTGSSDEVRQADSVGAPFGSAPPRVKQGMKVKDILKNPALAKLLITAAKKVKQKQAEEERELKMKNEPN